MNSVAVAIVSVIVHGHTFNERVGFCLYHSSQISKFWGMEVLHKLELDSTFCNDCRDF